MTRIVFLIAMLLSVFSFSVRAQTAGEVVWVQIEAQPNLAGARDRASQYAAELPDVNGFALGGGWFGIALGPYTRADAEQVLRSYRAQRLIPRDSYIALSNTYRDQYWPDGADILQRGSLAAQSILQNTPEAPEAPVEEAAETAPEVNTPIDTETPNEARRSERALSREEREELQKALKWAGFYSAAIDGAFGRGTRNSMAAWQISQGLDRTGILTTMQRAMLLQQYNAVFEGLGMTLVRNDQAGIEVTMPADKVVFARLEAPFAQYDANSDLDARVLLISQPGDQNTLTGLYDIMQTLEIVPLEGPRNQFRNGFNLVGQNDKIVSETRVTLLDGEIKGFTLIWPAGDEERRSRVIDEMQASFNRLDGVLDLYAGAGSEQQVDLIAGLQVRQPLLSRSGFFVDTDGSVVTTVDAVQSCTRITLDDLYDATLSSVDADRGIAVLKPSETLAPPAVARFSPITPRLQSEVAVAGYSFEGQLGAPSVTFGTLSDLKGLRGEQDLNRIAVDALPGDVGGPVFDDQGNVFGMLLPQPKGTRQLPEEVRFALTGEAIAGVLAQAGVSARTGEQTASLAPEDITTRGVDMTVLVSCWE